MTKDRIFADREKAMEESYFRKQNEALLAALRSEAGLDEIARVLRDKLNTDNPDLLRRARELGITAETAPALFCAPLVQVAWAEGSVSKREREAVLQLAAGRGVDAGSPAAAQLGEWLDVRPSDALFDTALEVLESGFSVLPREEREERIQRLVDACRKVAEASGSEVARLIGLGDGVSPSETSILTAINARLRIHR